MKASNKTTALTEKLKIYSRVLKKEGYTEKNEYNIPLASRSSPTNQTLVRLVAIILRDGTVQSENHYSMTKTDRQVS